MKRFRFRLDRVERWRRQRLTERVREHEAAVAEAARTERALDEIDAFTREALEEMSRRRREQDTVIEMVRASETMRASIATRRSATEAESRAAGRVVERTLEQLVEARRELKALETLRGARLTLWKQDTEHELQKQADESHNARILLDRIERECARKDKEEGDRS